MIIDSPYLFDNLEPIDQLHAKPVELIQKNIPSEQWNSLDYTDTKGFDGFDVVWNSLAQLIGICLVVFAELESELEYRLYEVVNDRSSQLGMVVTRTMSFEQIRNIIAHAKWQSITQDGYVFSSIDTISNSSPELNLKYFKLHKDNLDQYRAYLQGVANAVDYIHSEYLEAPYSN